MVDLIAKTPCAGLLPVTVGALTLSEALPEAITWVAPFHGQTHRVEEAIRTATGCDLPAPNRMTFSDTHRAISVGPGQTLMLGPSIDVKGAALTDQSDAWAVVQLSGVGGADVLARLSPIDLRHHVFEPGHTARTLIGHMTGSITRLDADTWEIMVFRSMALTLVHDITRAMRSIDARQRLEAATKD